MFAPFSLIGVVADMSLFRQPGHDTAMAGSGPRRTNWKTETNNQLQSGGSRTIPHGILLKNRSKIENQLIVPDCVLGGFVI